MTRSSRPPRRRTMPWKVDFAYPGGAKGRLPKYSFADAETDAGAIAQRGAQVVLSYLPPSDGPGPAPKLATFLRVESGNVHKLSWQDGDKGRCFSCSCGRGTREQEEIRWHLERFGRCSFCIGERTVHGADGGFLAGLSVDCPVCGGTGAVADMEFHDVRQELYVPRLQAVSGMSATGQMEEAE